MTNDRLHQSIEQMSEYGKIHTDGSRSGGQPVGDPLTCRACAQNRGTILQLKQELADFKQEMSDAAEMAVEAIGEWSDDIDKAEFLHQFIIPKPKPDPLVEAMKKMGWYLSESFLTDAEKFRDALDACGWEIREKGQ
jgi:hypothetical protein